MATVNFPDTATTNDIYTENGRSWKYNGVGWTAIGTSLTLADSATNVYVASTTGLTDGINPDTSLYPLMVGNASVGSQKPHIDTAFVYNSSTDTLTTTNQTVSTALTTGTINKVTITAPATSATLTIANGKTLTVNNSLTLAGTDATTMTFPTTSATIARTDAAQTFTGTQTFGTVSATSITGSPSVTAGALTATGITNTPIGSTNPSTGAFTTIAGTALTIDSTANLDTITTTVNVATATAIFTDTTAYKTAEYLVQIVQGSNYRASKILLISPGGTASITSFTEYAIVENSANSISATFTAAASSGNVTLSAAITNANTTNATVKVVRIGVV